MKKLTRQIQVLLLIAMLIPAIAYISMPAYAEGIYTEPVYVSKAPKFYPSKKTTKVALRWSTAYARLEDGTVTDVTGYEIQYSTRKSFSKFTRITKPSDVHSMSLELKKLNTKKKYKEYINKYYIRIRSYVVEDGRTYYSKWNNAARTKKVKVYGPVVATAVAARDNKITLKWGAVSGCDGYMVYGKAAEDTAWQKKYASTDTSVKKFVDKDIKYGTDMEYMILSHKVMKTADPRSLNSSCLSMLDDTDFAHVVSMPEFSLDKPEITAQFNKNILDVTWSGTGKAESYFIEYDTNEDFSTRQQIAINAKDLIEDSEEYTNEIEGLTEKTDYFVRVRSYARYDGKDYYSEYSDVKKARYDNLTYTIKFIGNKATTGKMGSYEVQCDQDFKLPTNSYTRDGYEFVGWSTEQNSEVNMEEFMFGRIDYLDKETVRNLAEPDKTITLYACWAGATPEAAADWALRIAKDDTFHYPLKGQKLNHCFYCQGGDTYYNCNSLVNAAYTHGMPYFSGYQSGSTYPDWWAKKGFTKVGTNISTDKIKKGDIICCHNGKRWAHVMIAISSTQIVHAVNKGNTPQSITKADTMDKVARYKKYAVMRLELED